MLITYFLPVLSERVPKGAEKTALICEPLFNNFGITVFGYSNFLNDGTYLDVCTNDSWQGHYLEHFASHNFIHEYVKYIHTNNIRYTVWNNDISHPRNPTFSQFIIDSCHFEIWHGFSIYKHHASSLEAWHFATSKENYQITNFYLNNLDLLEHFIFYFRGKASCFINEADTRSLVVLKDRTPFISSMLQSHTNNNRKDYVNKTNIQRYAFKTPSGNIYLSRREVECIFHLSSSKTIKEIASKLSLSPRTVEGYINSSKEKLGCPSRSKLLEVFSSFNEQHNQFLF